MTALPRILVVDDEEILRRSLERALGREYHVETESSGRGALARVVAGERFDAILTDLMMPNMGGIELHAAIAAIDAAQAGRMVFMSGSSFEEAAREFLRGVDGRWIQKPFDRKDVLLLLRRLLDGRSRANE